MYSRRFAVVTTSTVAALLMFASSAGATIAYQSTSGSRLMTASDRATGATRLGVTGTSPLISPDGTRVAYIGGTMARPRLRIRTITTGAEVVASAMPGTAVGLGIVWAPDSARLLMPMTRTPF